MIGALTDHLWQSTLFVLAAAILAALLRHNGAHVRHAIWLIASVKFLVPFAWLTSLGALLPRFTPAVSNAIGPAPGSAADLPIAVNRIAAPFTSGVFASPASSVPPPAPDWTAAAIAAAWSCGFAIVVLMRCRDWRRIRAAVRASLPTALTGPVPVRAFAGLLGPGVVGVWRPVLLVPAGIHRCLTPAQLQTILEHEFCHVRRRDNLTSAIHMLVESLFWFHPLVWWIGARIVDERERACDEHVLRSSGHPEEYAESILNVCKFYVESRLACVSGVAGSDLKKRIAAIMGNRVGLPLSSVRKAVLTAMAVFVVALPMWAGLLSAPLGALGAAPGQRFDVVSIKPCPDIRTAAPRTAPSGGGRGAVAPWAAQTSPGYVYWHCVTLAQLVDQAYADADHPLINTIARPQQDSVQPKRVRGGPAWVDRDMFTIEARAPVDLTNPALKGRPAQNLLRLPAAMSAALRATLEDRFQVQVRRETEQRNMLALRIAKTGLEAERIKATQPGDCVTVEKYFEADPAAQRRLGICGRYRVSATAWEVSGMTLKQIAGEVSDVMDRVLVDETGVDTPFSFVLDLGRASTDAAVETRFIRAFGALGLAIAETRGAAEYLVIDRAQKPRPDGPSDSADPPARAKGPGR